LGGVQNVPCGTNPGRNHLWNHAFDRMNHSQYKSYFKAIIGKMQPRHRAEIWCELNRYEWPEEFQNLKPDCWDDMSRADRSKMPICNALWAEVNDQTNRKDCLRAWNKKMTDEEFEEFWKTIHDEWNQS
jgi:hypothetical protein